MVLMRYRVTRYTVFRIRVFLFPHGLEARPGAASSQQMIGCHGCSVAASVPLMVMEPRLPMDQIRIAGL